MRPAKTAWGFVLVWLLSAAANAQPEEHASALYALSPESTFGDGCDSSCLCAVSFLKGLQGTFVLTLLEEQGLTQEYAVSDILWILPFGEVRGSGTYTIGGEGVSMHRLAVNLSVGQAPPELYDSGPVPSPEVGRFPSINLPIAGNFEGCFYTRFGIDAFPVKEPFRRGDSNTDGTLDLSDAIFIFTALFGSGRTFTCQDSADSDDSGVLDITDGIFLLGALFREGSPPPAPFVGCGDDPTSDNLGCASFPSCLPIAE